MGSTWGDANTAQPQGFVPSHLAEPALRGRAATELEYVAVELGGIRLAADLIADGQRGLRTDKAAATEIGETATRLQRLVRAMAAGALGLAVLAGALVGGGAQPAAAATTTPLAVPAIETPQPDPVTQHLTRFGRGTWLDLGNGDLAVRAPLKELVPTCGWLPSPYTAVQVQEFSVKRGRWMVRKVLTTSSRGIAGGVAHLGGGFHTVRVVHPADAWTLRTEGSTRRVDVSDEPLDVN